MLWGGKRGKGFGNNADRYSGDPVSQSYSIGTVGRVQIPVSISSAESFTDSTNLWANNLAPHPSAPPHGFFTAFFHNWSDDGQDDIFALFIRLGKIRLNHVIARQNIVFPEDSDFLFNNVNRGLDIVDPDFARFLGVRRDVDIDVVPQLALSSSYMGFEKSVVSCLRVVTAFCDVWFAIAAVRSVHCVVCWENVVRVCSLHVWRVLLDVWSDVRLVVGLNVRSESDLYGVGRMAYGGTVWGGDWRAPEKHRVKSIPDDQPIDRTHRVSIKTSSRMDDLSKLQELCKTYRTMRFNVPNPPPVIWGPDSRLVKSFRRSFLCGVAGGFAGSTTFVPFFVPFFDAAMPFFLVKLAMSFEPLY